MNSFYRFSSSEFLTDILDSLSRITGCEVGLVTNDLKWIENRVRRHVECGFCRIVECTREGSEICDNLSWRAQIVAASFKQKYIYKCHYGLIELVIPIYKENRYLGSLYCGNFLDRQPDEKNWEEISEKLPYDTDKEDLKKEFFNIPFVNAQRIYDLQTALGLTIDSIAEILSNENCSFSNFDRIIEYIDKNFQRGITLEDLACISGYNPSYISQMFKKRTGSTLTDYVTRVRIKKAKELLINSDMNISEIAFAIGYEDQNYFSRVFKISEKISPNAFRSKCRGAINKENFTVEDDQK